MRTIEINGTSYQVAIAIESYAHIFYVGSNDVLFMGHNGIDRLFVQFRDDVSYIFRRVSSQILNQISTDQGRTDFLAAGSVLDQLFKYPSSRLSYPLIDDFIF